MDSQLSGEVAMGLDDIEDIGENKTNPITENAIKVKTIKNGHLVHDEESNED